MADNESPLGGPLELPDNGAVQPRHQNGKPQRGRGWLKKFLIFLVVLAVLAGVGYAAGKLINKHGSAATSNDKQSTQSASKSSSQTKENDVPAVTGLKKFTSSSLGIELAYPDSWSATEANGGVRFESPNFNYPTVDKGTLKGNFRVYIRKGAREVDSKYIARGVATQDSEPLAYTAPTSTQRKTTTLSFFGLDTSDQFAYFLVAGNFDLKKGDTLGPTYGKEVDTVLVTGGYSAKDLSDDFATNQVALNYFETTDAYKQALDIMKSLKIQ